MLPLQLADPPASYPDLTDALATPGQAWRDRLINASKGGSRLATQLIVQRQARVHQLRPSRRSTLDPSNPWESIEQADLADFLDHHPANLAWFHVPNERASRKRAAALSIQGVKSGVPDVLILSPPPPPLESFSGLAIELKRRRARPSDLRIEQRRWLATLRKAGFIAEVCCGAAAAIAVVEALYGPGVPS